MTDGLSDTTQVGTWHDASHGMHALHCNHQKQSGHCYLVMVSEEPKTDVCDAWPDCTHPDLMLMAHAGIEKLREYAWQQSPGCSKGDLHNAKGAQVTTRHLAISGKMPTSHPAPAHNHDKKSIKERGAVKLFVKLRGEHGIRMLHAEDTPSLRPFPFHPPSAQLKWRPHFGRALRPHLHRYDAMPKGPCVQKSVGLAFAKPFSMPSKESKRLNMHVNHMISQSKHF